MVLKHIHDTNMRARGEPERVFTVSTAHGCVVPTAAVSSAVTARCLPLQVNRIKIPKQLDELVEMQNESTNPVFRVLSKIKAELRGVSFVVILLFFFNESL